ncbi:MAG: Eco57I restriction-modification methylase domain-containing protein [Armatimonadota bacterium]
MSGSPAVLPSPPATSASQRGAGGEGAVGRASAVPPSPPATSASQRGAGGVAAVSRLRILDPACGSGSFLLGAYDWLLNWHLQYYLSHDPDKQLKARRPVLVKDHRGEWRLSTAERKRILLDNLYGVDIDPQAVEVTKLNLLLKCLEGETEQTLQTQQQMFHERVLPNIDSNIKCGNSLIGPDYYTGRLDYDEEEQRRVNAFDWQREFKEIMNSGGFDCVIGNPPYGATLSVPEVDYIATHYSTMAKDLDTYGLFMEKAAHLCRPRGILSMIVPTGWYSSARFRSMRRHIAQETDPIVFVNLPYDIFNAWVDTTIFVAAKREAPAAWPRQEECIVQLKTFPKRHRIVAIAEFEQDVAVADICDWFADGADEFLTYADRATSTLMQKLRRVGVPLSDIADVQRGVTPFVLCDRPDTDAHRLALDGTVRRYSLEHNATKYIQFDDTLAEPKPERYFLGPRLLLRELISRQFRLQLTKATDDFVTNKSMQSVLATKCGPALDYLLGVLNSRLLSWYFLRLSNVAQRDDFPKIVLRDTRSLPIRPIDFANPPDVAKHDRMVALVQTMLDLNERLPKATNPRDRDLLQRQIEGTDDAIDHLVYELYELTEEEIAIVEGKR